MLEPNMRLTNRFHWICWWLISLQTTKENQDLKAVRQVSFTDWRAMLGIWESLKRHMEPSRENQSNPFPVQDSEILSMGQNICIGFGLDLAQFVTSPTYPHAQLHLKAGCYRMAAKASSSIFWISPFKFCAIFFKQIHSLKIEFYSDNNLALTK